ncbi:MAG: DUF3369 domain-containing protein [Clostridiaceae bacterium]|nr:DUF3369 domain-containing protein [Clostridiaceae bacterium]
MMTDLLDFAPETLECKDTLEERPWKIIIVDDEKEVHRITEMVLEDFLFNDKKLTFLHAYTAKEAKELIGQHPDTAVMLLDVVMEEKNSGLQVVKYIREELNNPFVRIVLRTGHPGEAPEKKVILDYDINDYKEKTELTSIKLFTTMISALRNYRDMMVIEKNRRALEKIVHASATIFELQSMKSFAAAALSQMTALLNLDNSLMLCHVNGFAATVGNDDYYIVVGTGIYEKHTSINIKDVVSSQVCDYIQKAIKEKKNIYGDGKYIAYFENEVNTRNIIYLENIKKLTEVEESFVDLFCSNLSIAFDNLYLKKELEDTQKEVVFTLGELTEARSYETGNHVKRVSIYCKILANSYGLSDEEINMLEIAAPMHDVGKVAIPDVILNKPGKLTEEEYQLVKQHAAIGHDILSKSNREIMMAAATIALQHHEKYDGTGYPKGLRGEDIHIFARIVGLADVFDALSNDRVYKRAWDMETILNYIEEEKGKHFDPKLVEIFFQQKEEIMATWSRLRD